MNKKLLGISILGIVFAMVFTLGVGAANAFSAPPVDRDLAEYHMGDINLWGNDKAYTSARGADRDADFRAYTFAPETYGLGGNVSDFNER